MVEYSVYDIFLLVLFNRINKLKLIFFIIFLSIICYLLFDGKQNLVIIQAFLYILLTLNWFYKQIKDTDQFLIYKKLNFWLSTGLLLWSSVYIFRILPAYFFAHEDLSFLKDTINKIYQSTVILSYLIILKGLFCKQ